MIKYTMNYKKINSFFAFFVKKNRKSDAVFDFSARAGGVGTLYSREMRARNLSESTKNTMIFVKNIQSWGKRLL